MYKGELDHSKDQYNPLTDIDPQAEWQARYGALTSKAGGTVSPEVVMSSSQLEESLLADIDTLGSFSQETYNHSFDAGNSRQSPTPTLRSQPGPLTSTPKPQRTYKDDSSESEGRRSLVKDSGYTSGNTSLRYDNTSKETTPVKPKVNGQESGRFSVQSGEVAEIVTKDLFSKLAKGGNGSGEKHKVTRLTSVPVAPGRVMFLDESNLFHTIDSEQQLNEINKGDDKLKSHPSDNAFNEILKQLTTIPIDKIHHFSIIGEHLSNLHQQTQLLDVIIYVGNQVFKAHRVALSCFSKYFADSFERTSEKVKLPLEIKLHGISPDAFRIFLEYVYLATIEITPEYVGDLIMAADFLSIPVIKEKCVKYMDAITADQALVAVQTGKLPITSEAYRMSRQCIIEHFTDCYDTIPFNQLSLDNLCALLRDDRLLVSSEMDVFWAGLKWIAYNMKDREQYLNQVMECVRFPYLSHSELFKCLESNDLLKNSDKCREMLIQANWIVSTEDNKKSDLLDLPKPLPRICFRRDIVINHPATGSTDTFMTIPDDNTPSFKDLRNAFSCEVVTHEPAIKVGVQKSQPVASRAPTPAPRSISPSFISGDILVIGGFQQDTKENHTEKHVERYYSNDNQWKYYAELPEPRHHHAVAFLGGKLYLSGGTDAKKTFTKRHPLPLNKVFQFDPSQKVWRECGLMNSSRMYHKMCALYGMLYAIGGQDEKSRVLASVECYNSKTNSWIYARPMNSARMGFGAAVNDGKIYVAGGHGEHLDKKTALPILQSVEAFDPRTNQWVTMTDLRIPRCYCCLVSVGSCLYLCGGASSSYPAAKDGTFSSVGLIEMFDPGKNKWEFKAEMSLPRHHHGIAVIGTKIFLVGGMSTTNFKTLKSVECFDTATETWDNSVRDMPMPAKWICCSVLPVSKH
ncbi:hypothetical protein SNE40_015015 [Patella caerulea]|uniref:BTB domain-containing protein n=1 Tax=Patella caerulea TaxID=87958 RepID=A0AAN8JJ83_PATCE